MAKRFEKEGDQIIVHTTGEICNTPKAVVESHVFESIVGLFLNHMVDTKAPLLERLGLSEDTEESRRQLTNLIRTLCVVPLHQIAGIMPRDSNLFGKDTARNLLEFVERLYDFWRSFDRYMVLHSEPGPSNYDQRPYRSFNKTIESLTDVVRSTYRDICEHISGDHPRIYRQVAAGCNVGLIASSMEARLPREYQSRLEQVPFIRQVWIAPPLILDPPMNKRSGQFDKVCRSPLTGITLNEERWLCYPARVGPLTIFIYFHQRFIGLGCSLANLFELATDEQIAKGPDAITLFGLPPDTLEAMGDVAPVFYDDESNDLLVAAIPGEDRFGYFGYLKKITLTLHNVVMMKRRRMPFHGAMVRLVLKSGESKTLLLIGDTAAGKSESLEAFRLLGGDVLREMRIIADDMGSMEITPEGKVLGYGTETGAFVRLDDLQKGYAFGQIDRAVIMSPHRTNARVVLPVTNIEEVLAGHNVDLLLYANNFEDIDETHPILQKFATPREALETFRRGASMGKGTTEEGGLVANYFANIFGPPQYKEIHEELAEKTFEAAFEQGAFVGVLRTRLGKEGFETQGPAEAAKALLEIISN